jgi:hypothetical protein
MVNGFLMVNGEWGRVKSYPSLPYYFISNCSWHIKNIHNSPFNVGAILYGCPYFFKLIVFLVNKSGFKSQCPKAPPFHHPTHNPDTGTA